MRLRQFFGIGLGALASVAVSAPTTGGEAFPRQTLTVYQVQASTQVLADSVTRKLGQIRTVFASVGVLLSNTQDERQVYQALNRMISGLHFVRAILLLQDNGTLAFDSAAFPAVNMDLSDRAYFHRAIQGPPGRLWVEAPLTGRASGLPFIPVASRIETPHGNWVAVAIVLPDGLIQQSLGCSVCSIALLDPGGQVLAAAPSGYRPQPYVLQRILSNSSHGPLSVELDMVPFVADWQAVEDDALLVLFSRHVF